VLSGNAGANPISDWKARRMKRRSEDAAGTADYPWLWDGSSIPFVGSYALMAGVLPK